jgi:hypothetical protein
MLRLPVRIAAVLVLASLLAPPSAGARRSKHPARALPPPAAPARPAGGPVAGPSPLGVPPGDSSILSAAEVTMISRSSAGLVSRTLEDGGEYLDLKCRFRDFVVVTKSSDGRRLVRCVSDAAMLRMLLATPPSAAPATPATPASPEER